MATSHQLEPSAQVTLATTELNALANNAAALSAEHDNTANGYIFGRFELNVTFGTNPTAGTTVNAYLIVAQDGTNYSDAITGAGGTAPSTSYIGGFPVRAVTTAQKIPLGIGLTQIFLPACKFKILLVNAGTGQAFGASGHTLKMTAERFKSV